MCAFPRWQDQLRAMRINKPDDGGDPVTATFGDLLDELADRTASQDAQLIDHAKASPNAGSAALHP